MATRRVLAPATGDTLSFNGRTYTGIGGTVLDVPDFDAGVLEANGWFTISGANSGPTTARPPTLGMQPGFKFLDTTLAALITFDGLVWRNSITGASV